ncbi:MAG TPA: GNAT family N-acetyltransferase [Gemmataceae bacterium]|jgi:RimJ/RimL family protein N-acetyltransferase|nr:GNAT family N-acetyltransferase [Gemmataceae bacterium]
MREPLLTSRLVLRDVTEADAELLFDLDSDPEVLRYVGPRHAPDVAGYRDRIRTAYLPMQSHPWYGVRTVHDRASGEFLGWVFVRPSNASRHAADLGWERTDEAEVGYRYRRSAWGAGIATEAATPLVALALADPETTAVVACASANNAGSLRVLRKLGLEHVAEVRMPETGEVLVKLARGTRRVPGGPSK